MTRKYQIPRNTSVCVCVGDVEEGWRLKSSELLVAKSGNCLRCYNPTRQWVSLFVRTGLITSLWFEISKDQYERSHDLPYRYPVAVAVYMDMTWSVSASDAQNAIGYSQRRWKPRCHLDLFVTIAQCTPGMAVTWPCLAVRYVAACNYQSRCLVATWSLVRESTGVLLNVHTHMGTVKFNTPLIVQSAH